MTRPANDNNPSGDLAALVEDLAALAVEFHLDGRFEESVDVHHEKEHANERDPGLDDPPVAAGG
ncbi:MAG TPA: hypothetical protein VHK47_21100 [Polyangia bacterium]|nr:hypothetical protein [Polyangia bacterium]